LTLDLVPEAGWLYRKFCRKCKQSFTLLPDDVLPLHSYGMELIVDRLMAGIDGISLRSFSFYEEAGLVPFGCKERHQEGISWSDLLEAEPLNPSYQLFHQWQKRFSERAQSWLRCLLVACVLAGCDLHVCLGESLESFGKCPKGLHPLLLATGLVGLLQERPVRLCLGETVRLLCGSQIGTHKPLRAAGRPPPQYGGDLDFKRSRQTNGGISL